MKARGMTMLELLLAIVLLSEIVTATAAWTQIAAVASSPTGRVASEKWSIAANAVLDLIGQDLAAGDFVPEKSGTRSNELARVTATDDHVLTITTRAGLIGAVTHVYRLAHPPNDDGGMSLELVENANNRQFHRPLLDQVKDWQCRIDLEHHWMDVTMNGPTEQELTRRYALP